ncbi:MULTISPECIES: DnaT-like ssDNA-binding domain-containing protein [unclassified Cedecea]|uniref:DnaT-like ssDNA-binding domain-containing protein n=1 Tax=unclassified Cedecea TaxID=2649846 RepID=UPI003017E98D
MARIRTIKPEFWTDEDMAEVSEAACLLAIGLLNYADDEGYFNANPKLIKAAVFPIRETCSPITVLIRELSNHGYLSMFSTQDGKHFGLINNFAKHQVINKPKDSKIKSLHLIPYEYGTDTAPVLPGKDQGSGKGKDKPLSSAGTRESVSPRPAAANSIIDNRPPSPGGSGITGKFTMYQGWRPDDDFLLQAAQWGCVMTEPPPETALAEFVTYWEAEGKAFHHVQWQQKFSQALKRRAIESKTGGNDVRIQQAGATGGRAVERIRAAIAAEREREGVPPVGNDGGDVFGSMGGKERDNAVIDLESGDWRSE